MDLVVGRMKPKRIRDDLSKMLREHERKLEKRIEMYSEIIEDDCAVWNEKTKVHAASMLPAVRAELIRIRSILANTD